MVRRPERRQAERLRHVVECLPHETRVAMLAGLERYDRIIVGAYTDRKGGVCPMLAAHRCGGRTDFSSFARAWDRFTGAGRRARAASERELRTLEVQLEGSLWRDQQVRAEIAGVTAEAAVPAPVPEPGGPIRGQRRRLGAAWLRPFRRWDGYSDAVAAAMRQAQGDEGATAGPAETPAPSPERDASPREPAGSR